ncbi:hypothetical protein BCR32DRAFT_270506 [Anaeromyces robustus]|uniref:Ankyrin n=1 Tax=Anaeromyces robustus TaxID=1754192 RepID=A0A1Y1WW15_9FUNG|nr:hypothetical protein BCR32DRAFT_270506 [Anaeromyces robustus]|eukprot:ORX77652.1 hypothetical protein BCR32DRAFT_270506 [Anaeromyces robustus]
MYRKAISNKNYKALQLLYRFDKRDINHRLDKLFKLLNSDVSSQMEFIKIVKNKMVKLPIDDYFLTNLQTIEEKRDIIKNMIVKDNINELDGFLKEHHFLLSYYNNSSRDILMDAINNNVSYDMIKFILDHCFYETLNYTVQFYNSPLLSVLIKKDFKVADLLLKYGADINYKVFFNDRIIYYLYYRDFNSKVLKYSLSHGLILADDVFDLPLNLIENQQNDLLEIIFKYCIYDTDFIQTLLHIYKNNTSLSYKELRNMIYNEKKKIRIKSLWYDTAINKENIDAIKILVQHDTRKYFKALKYLSG